MSLQWFDGKPSRDGVVHYLRAFSDEKTQWSISIGGPSDRFRFVLYRRKILIDAYADLDETKEVADTMIELGV